MKKTINVIALVLASIICKTATAQETAYYGKKIDEKDAITMQELTDQMKDKQSREVKVTGKVKEVCQEMGCWMTLEKGDGTAMRVRMKGHSFFVPKNSSGKTAIIQGKAEIKTISVEELKDYAADSGQPEEFVAAIKEPKTELVFVAEGVILKD